MFFRKLPKRVLDRIATGAHMAELAFTLAHRAGHTINHPGAAHSLACPTTRNGLTPLAAPLATVIADVANIADVTELAANRTPTSVPWLPNSPTTAKSTLATVAQPPSATPAGIRTSLTRRRRLRSHVLRNEILIALELANPIVGIVFALKPVHELLHVRHLVLHGSSHIYYPTHRAFH